MLGSDYEVALGVAPKDLAASATTGLRQYMGDIDYLVVLFVGAASAAAEQPVLTLKQHTAASSGTSSNLATVDRYWKKTAATLANTEQWVEVTQAASQTVTGTAQVQQMIAFKVSPEQLAAGNNYISVDIADVGAGVQPGVVLYITSAPGVRGLPTIMPPQLR